MRAQKSSTAGDKDSFLLEVGSRHAGRVEDGPRNAIVRVYVPIELQFERTRRTRNSGWANASYRSASAPASGCWDDLRMLQRDEEF